MVLVSPSGKIAELPKGQWYTNVPRHRQWHSVVECLKDREIVCVFLNQIGEAIQQAAALRRGCLAACAAFEVGWGRE